MDDHAERQGFKPGTEPRREAAATPRAEPSPDGSPRFPLAYWPGLEQVVGPSGLLAETLPGYERRIGQELMMRAVASSIEHRQPLMVEAGTGTGKSLAYLLPAALSGEQVILSTGTRTLQTQLAQTQVPFVRDILGVDFTAAVLKGRTNYLCLERLAQARRTPGWMLDEHAALQTITAWSQETTTGDRAELTTLADDANIWTAVSTGSEGCVGRRCEFYEPCFVVAARRRAQAADVVIVNHHLFFADAALRARGAGFALLPDVSTVIFDEAHHLEDIAANHFGLAVSNLRLKVLTRDCRRVVAYHSRDASGLEPACVAVDKAGAALFRRLSRYVDTGRLGPEVIDRDERLRDRWGGVEASLEALTQGLRARAPGLEGIERLADRSVALREALSVMLAPADLSAREAAHVEALALPMGPDGPARPPKPQTPLVVWVEKGPRALFLRAAPVEVDEPMSDAVLGRFPTTIFTSATLTTGGTFDHSRERLGLGEATWTLSVPSPFDYQRQALLYLPSDLPAPRDEAYAAACADRMAALVEIVDGGALLLFTSFRQMHAVHALLSERWEAPDDARDGTRGDAPDNTRAKKMLMQGEAPREVLLEGFRSREHNILLATQSFWEGVDISGDALQLVVIDKLPFAPPNDPLVAARSEAIAAAGGNGFMGYQVPNAIIRLKQGFGRLIRHRNDRGIVAILDPRLSRSRYGKAFLRSLPELPTFQSIDALTEAWQRKDPEPVPF